jgi:hypothetical protein
VRKPVQRVLTLAVVSTLAGSVFLAASPPAEPRARVVRVASGDALANDAFAGNDLLFPSTSKGHSSTLTCYGLCISDTAGLGICGSAAGTFELTTPPTSPFQLINPRVTTIEAHSCGGTPATFPVALAKGELLLFDLTFSPTSAGQFNSSFTTTILGTGRTFTQAFFGTTVGANCVESDTTSCLSFGRFAVSATWKDSAGATGSAHLQRLTLDTANMWFFSPSSIEVEVKVADGCALGGHYWFFAGGLTNVRVVITVTDTLTGATKTYTNRLGTAFKPVQDTAAFSTCP